MSLIGWVKDLFSKRGHALAAYRRGMEKANIKDFAGAIVDYTKTIEASDVPKDVKAMALYNRALAHSSLEHPREALEDLNAVIAMRETPENIKQAAKERLGRLKRRNDAAERA